MTFRKLDLFPSSGEKGRHLLGWAHYKEQVPSKFQYMPMELHGVTSKKTVPSHSAPLVSCCFRKKKKQPLTLREPLKPANRNLDREISKFRLNFFQFLPPLLQRIM
jgi:hypothetical protein